MWIAGAGPKFWRTILGEWECPVAERHEGEGSRLRFVWRAVSSGNTTRWVDLAVERTICFHRRLRNPICRRVKAVISGKVDVIMPPVATNRARFHTHGSGPKRDIGRGIKSNQFPAGPAQNTPIDCLLTHKPFA